MAPSTFDKLHMSSFGRQNPGRDQEKKTVMTSKLLKDGLGWGFVLWLIGYLLGIVLFMAVPPSILGWVIMPIGAITTLLVLSKKIWSKDFRHYLKIAILWTIIAVLFDYIFLVQLFKPEDGYYKLDVYIYYLLTFALPLLVGWWKTKSS